MTFRMLDPGEKMFKGAHVFFGVRRPRPPKEPAGVAPEKLAEAADAEALTTPEATTGTASPEPDNGEPET